MAHTHEGDEGYFLDQIFTIALCGALGAIAVLLSINKTMLNLILHEKFHPFILMGGITLLVLVAIRIIAVWQKAGEVGTHSHTHDHHHDHNHAHCDHDHGTCDHDQGHQHEHVHEQPQKVTGLSLGLDLVQPPSPAPAAHEHHHHDHDHHHGHDHDHGHDHGHDHDGGWAPWRYTILMLPIVLFLLNLPNEGFSANFKDVHVEDELAPQLVVSSVGLANPQTGGPLLSAMLLYPNCNDRYTGGVVRKIDYHDLRFSNLERAANDATLRAELTGKSATILGKFVASGENNRFGLVRYRMNCCAADALPLNAVMMVTPSWDGERLDVKERQQKWVKVTGRIFFLKKRGGEEDYVPAIIIIPGKDQPPNALVEIIDQPANPYAT